MHDFAFDTQSMNTQFEVAAKNTRNGQTTVRDVYLEWKRTLSRSKSGVFARDF